MSSKTRTIQRHILRTRGNLVGTHLRAKLRKIRQATQEQKERLHNIRAARNGRFWG